MFVSLLILDFALSNLPLLLDILVLSLLDLLLRCQLTSRILDFINTRHELLPESILQLGMFSHETSMMLLLDLLCLLGHSVYLLQELFLGSVDDGVMDVYIF